MKVALALSGQPRFFQICYDHFYSNLIESMDCHVYFHTWWSPKMVGTLYPCPTDRRAVLDDEDMRVPKDLIEELVDMYTPEDYLFEDYASYDSSTNFQYYSQWAVKSIMSSDYDLVIRSRFDLMCTQDIEFVYDDSLWVPSCCPYTDRCSDLFSISNWDVFNKITDVHINIEEFRAVGKGEMEWALQSQIEKEGVNVRKFQASYDSFDILRSKDKIKFE